jgi:hypothetical protein
MYMTRDEYKFFIGMIDRRVDERLKAPDGGTPVMRTLWEVLRDHGVGLYTAQMIVNDVMLNGVSLPVSRPNLKSGT